MESEMNPVSPSAVSDCGSDCEIENATTHTNDGENIQLVTSVEDMLAGLAAIPQEYSIFRVPTKMREVNEKAYTPQTVSIGPLHRGKPELIGMEDYKMICLKSFLDRTAMTVQSCFKLIRSWEERVRGCYAETIGLSSDEFVKMVLVDSAFIIECMLRCAFNETHYGVDEFVRADFILLENQLPFWVLDGIFHLAFTHYPIKHYRLPSFLEVSVGYFIMTTDCLIQDPPKGISSSGVKHLVDLMRLIHLPSSKSKSTPKYDMEYIRVKTATELQEAGMKFKSCRSSSSKSFLEMTYHSKGVLEIPRFHLTDASESMLRNLVALEVLLYQNNSYTRRYPALKRVALYHILI